MEPKKLKRGAAAREADKVRRDADSLLGFAQLGREATLASTLEILNSRPPAAWKVGLDYGDDKAFGKKKPTPVAVSNEVSEKNILEPRARRATKATQKVIENSITTTTKNPETSAVSGSTSARTEDNTEILTLKIASHKLSNLLHHLTSNSLPPTTTDTDDNGIQEEEDGDATMAPLSRKAAGKRKAIATTEHTSTKKARTSSQPTANTTPPTAVKVATKAKSSRVKTATRITTKKAVREETPAEAPTTEITIKKATEVETSAEGASVLPKIVTRKAAAEVETFAEEASDANTSIWRAAKVETSVEETLVPDSITEKATEVETSAEGASVRKMPVGRKAIAEVETSAEGASVAKKTGRKTAKEETHAESSSTAAARSRKASKAPSTKAVIERKGSEAPPKTTATKRKASEAPSTTPAPKRKASEAPSAVSAPKSKASTKAPPATTAAKGKAPAKASTRTKTAKGKAPVKNEKVAAQSKVTKKSAPGRKRKNEESDDDNNEDHPPPPIKKVKVTQTKAKPVINVAPTQKLDVYVFGEGSSGELGLGKKKNAINVKRPRLNPYLLREEVGVVHVACGGMHVGAITHDNQILTWGVNDQGALGRDTTWDGGNKEDDDLSDNEDEDLAFNPHECVPTAVDSKHFPEGTVFVMMACGDSFSMVLTATGDVYGWGTFRSNEGVFGFSTDVLVQREPTLLPALKNITQIACGSNHAMALNKKGEVFIWGCGQQNQLGHRLVERRARESLQPRSLSLTAKNIRYIGCGQDHSFAIGRDNRLWVWGVNSFGETSIPAGAGGDRAMIYSPQQVRTLTPETDETLLANGETITSITGGVHHSIAVTSTGRCLIWGRMDGDQVGIPENLIPNSSILRDEKGQARILIQPTEIPGLQNIVQAAIGSDHTIVINDAGEAYSWGFNVNYQCGLGIDDDIKIPTRIENTAVRGKKLLEAGGGGQYSVLTGLPPMEEEDEEL